MDLLQRRRRARRAAALRRLRARLPGRGGALHALLADAGRGAAVARRRAAGDRPRLVLGVRTRASPGPGRRAEVPPPAAGGRADGRPDRTGSRPAHLLERRGRRRSRRARRGCGAAASIRPASSRRPWRRGSTPSRSPAWRAAARAIRSAAAAPSASATRRGSSRRRGPAQRPPGRRRADDRRHPDRLRRGAARRRREAGRCADLHAAAVGGDGAVRRGADGRIAIVDAAREVACNL